jgi:hypothetical protein
VNDPTPGDPAASPPATAAPAASTSTSPAVASAARWFWWIAGLSVINVIMSMSQSKENFVVGLGITALADALFAQARPVAFTLDAVAIGFFVAMGHLARRGVRWAFVAGAAVYTLDGLLYLLARAWMPVAFHALVLFFILRGIAALREAS